MDDDELERFLREQKAKIARDQAQLEKDLPYMEMQAQPKQHAHVDYESESMKENIPQKGSNDNFKYNEDLSSFGMPLGAEYEKKKQKLKEQLRQDYRCYIAEKNFRSKGVVAFETEVTPSSQPLEKERPRTQVKETLAELLEERGQADRRHEQQDELSSRKKDAATSMEAYEELLNEHRRGRVVSFEDGLADPWTARLRHMSARHQSGGELAAERDKREEREERTKSAGTRHAPMHAPARTHGILPVHDVRCSLEKRKKERYRLDLLEQMAEREQNKRREKQWSMAVPVSGAVDPQKDPLRMLKMLGPGVGERLRYPTPPRDVPPPDRPRRAFHTPLPPSDNERENDAAARRYADGLRGTLTAALPVPGGGRFFPSSFATPYDPAYYYYAVHNPLEPGVPPYGTDVLLRHPNPDEAEWKSQRNVGTIFEVESGRFRQGQPPLPYYRQVNGPPLATNFANQWEGGDHVPQVGLPQHNPGLPLTGPWTQAALSQAQYNPAPGPPQVTQIPRGFPGLTIGLGGIGEADDAEGRRGSINKYQEDLQRQMKDTEEKKRRDRMEQDRQDARLEAEANTYNPWGKGGGGAPLRDEHGNLVTDLKQMRRQNEATVQNPLRSARRAAPDSRGTPSSFAPQQYNHGDHHPGTPDDAAVHGDANGQAVRGGTLLDPSLPPQAAEQERYKDFLRQQIEEKRQRAAEEREKIREEEEREERRLAEQRERIQREYEAEAEKKRKKEEEQRLKNEELARAAEERKKELERKRREDEEKRSEECRRQFERERQTLREEVEKTSSAQNPQAGRHQRNEAGATDHQSMRGASPPIPALVKKQGSPGTQQAQGNGVQMAEARYASPGTSHRADTSPRSDPPSRERRPADLHSRATTAENEGLSTGRGSPPVPARRNQLRTEGKGTDVLGKMSLLRKQLQSQQRHLESQLRHQESSEEHMDARSGAGAQRSAHSRAASRDVFEMVRMRVQAPVRRASSKGVLQAGPLVSQHPPPPGLNYPDDDELLDIQRSALARDQRRRRDTVRRPDPGSFENQLLGMNARDLGLHLPPDDEGARASRSSMLKSDSAFIGAFGEVFPMDSKGSQAPAAGRDGAWDLEPESRDVGVSPRDRRRARHVVPLEQRPMDTYEPRRPPASPSLLSESSINVERLRARNAERMRRLHQMTTPGDDVSLGDPDDILSRFVSPSRPYSAVTTATDVWLRPGSCDSPGGFTERSSGE